MALRRTARFLLGIAIVILMGVLLPPFISIARYRSQVGIALSRAVGRDVTIGSVSLRLLPQPGVTMENVVVAEDPRFGAEPMLRANEVVATLRLTSMWRGRFEVGSLSFKEPSLNLVRSADGHWNIESLLQRAAQTPVAPTSKPRPESRVRFPYIEASSGRINFKMGEEKRVWALIDADFALWLASEDEWHTRLRAKPVRTDTSMSDTGTIRVNGSMQRTARIDDSQFKFHVSLQDAQLGQLSTLIYGHDRGWRGGTDATVDIAGTSANVAVSGTASVDQFRRYDIMPSDSLRLEARCVSQYHAAGQELAGIECHLPAGEGEVSLRGSIAGLLDKPQYNLDLAAREVPLSYAVAFARRAKKDLPTDLTAAGSLSAALTAKSTGDAVVWDGGGSTRDFTLASSVLEEPLRLGNVQFVMQPQNVPASGRAAKPAMLPVAASYGVAVPPFPLAMGAAQAGAAQATFTRDGYEVNVAGTASIARLLQIGRAFGIPSPATAVESGAATHMAMRIAGEWRGFQQPMVTGTSDIANARFTLNGVAAPVQIAFASVQIQPTQVLVQNLAASAGPVSFAGWLRQSRGCPSPEPCKAEFSLRATSVALDDVNRILNPQLRTGEPWYRRLGGGASAPASLFSRLTADGQISIARLAVKNVVLQNLSGTLHLAPGKALVSVASATLFGGAARGEWQADFSGAEPSYSGTGKLQRAALAQLSAVMRDNWATGTADAEYRITASGSTSAELVRTAAATIDFTWKDGALRHLALGPARVAPATEAGALRINTFRGRAVLRDGVLTISDAQMQTPSGVYVVSGTASRTRELALTFTLNRTQQYNVGGTLAAPQVQAVNLAPPKTSVAR
jgi:uncharacterized protein involved in outer membrane biogenesis